MQCPECKAIVRFPDARFCQVCGCELAADTLALHSTFDSVSQVQPDRQIVSQPAVEIRQKQDFSRQSLTADPYPQNNTPFSSRYRIPWIPIIVAGSVLLVIWIVLIAVIVVFRRPVDTTTVEKQSDKSVIQQMIEGIQPGDHRNTLESGNQTKKNLNDTKEDGESTAYLSDIDEVTAVFRRYDVDEGCQIVEEFQLMPKILSWRDYYTEGLFDFGVSVTGLESASDDQAGLVVGGTASIESEDYDYGASRHYMARICFINEYSKDQNFTQEYLQEIEERKEFEGSLSEYIEKLESNDPEWQDSSPVLVQTSGNYKVKLYGFYKHDYSTVSVVQCNTRYDMLFLDMTNEEAGFFLHVDLDVATDTDAFLDVYEELLQIIRLYLQDDSIELPELRHLL